MKSKSTNFAITNLQNTNGHEYNFDMQELFLKVYGRVHRVCFRMDTEQVARDLNLVGWVKNVHDGTVEILAQGEKENLNKLEQWARQGPELAQVEKVESDYREVSDKFDSFNIEY